MRSVIVFAVLSIVAVPADDQGARPSPRRRYCELDATERATGPSADVCAQVARRWRALMGVRAIPGAIRVVDGPDRMNSKSERDWALEWHPPEAGRGVTTGVRADGFSAYEAENVLPHEAGHLLFGSYAIYLTHVKPSAEYGTRAPDWLDESPAVWMESARMRDARVASIVGTTPSLARLVTMDHANREAVHENAINPVRRWQRRSVTSPCAPLCTFLPESLRTKYRVTDIGINAQGRPDTNVWYSATNPNNVDTFEDREFYPLSYMLLRFIHARGGTIAVRELISRYREDPSPRTGVLVGLPGLPATFAAFERAWHAYLRSPPPEDP